MTAIWPVKTTEMHNQHFDSTIWNDFKFRDDDIIISTYAKSGTTWMQQIISQMLFNGETDIDTQAMSPWIDFRLDGFAFTLRVTEDPDGVATAMARFFELHAARAEAADMLFHPDKFVQPHVRAFFSDYLHRAAERGELRIFELEIGGIVVASRIAFLLGSDLYVYYTGYDPAWKTYSVMTVLVAETFKWAFAHGVERINLSTGRDQSKMRWKPREVLFRDAVQVSPTCGPGGIGAFLVYEALSRAKVRAGVRRRRAWRTKLPTGQRPLAGRSGS